MSWGRAFVAALRTEWVRITTVRASAVVLLVMVLLGAVVTGVFGLTFRGEEPDPELGAVLLTSGGSLIPLPFVALFMGVLGVLMVGHDYRHNLIRPVLTAVPVRTALLAGRLVVLAAVAVAAGVVALVVNALVAVLVVHDLPLDAGVARAALGYVLLGVLWAWLAAGLTWLLRGTAPVLVLLFLVPLVVEPVLDGLSLLPSAPEWLAGIGRWLPFAAGRSLALTGGGNADHLSPAQGGLLFAAVVAGVVLSGGVRLARSDA